MSLLALLGVVTPFCSCSEAQRGTLLLTPLALALVMVETTDLIFAVDSIPAIFAITGDPFQTGISSFG